MDVYRKHIVALSKRNDLSYEDMLQMIIDYSTSELEFVKQEKIDKSNTIYSFLSSIGIDYLSIDGKKVKLDQFGINGITHIRSIEYYASSSYSSDYKLIYNDYKYEIKLQDSDYKKIFDYIKSIQEWDITMNENSEYDKFVLHYIPNTNCILVIKGIKSKHIYISNLVHRKLDNHGSSIKDSKQKLTIAMSGKYYDPSSASIEIPLLVDKDGFVSENPIVNEIINYTK